MSEPLGSVAISAESSVYHLRRVADRVCSAVGMTAVDSGLICTALSEAGRQLLISGSGRYVEIYLQGSPLIDTVVFAMDDLPQVRSALNRSACFNSLGTTVSAAGEPQLQARVTPRQSRLQPGSPEYQGLAQLLNQPSRDQLMAQLQAQNQALADHREELEQKVADRTRSLTQMNEELAEARESAEAAGNAKAAFLAAMSHEIRTPMTGVIGMVDLLMQTELTGEQIGMLRTARDSAHALLTIINDILDFSKVEAGKMDLESIPLSVSQLVEGVADSLATAARGKDLRLRTFIDPDIPEALLGDPIRLRQILFNIGGNAVKFTEQGYVRIRAHALPNAAPGHAGVRFEISDDGIGISKAAQLTLFDEFSQADSTTTRRFGGTGLGLSICQRLTGLMGGTIGVDSELGEGSTFNVEIELPLSDSTDFAEEPFDLSGVRMLLYYIDAESAEQQARYFRSAGCDVEVQQEGEAALAALLEAHANGQPFDLAAIGSILPQDERIAFAERLRAQAGFAELPIMIGSETTLIEDLPTIPNTLWYPNDPAQRSRLLRTAAACVGRASPEVLSQPTVRLDTGISTKTPEEAEAAGQLILVADDNSTNRLVIGQQIKSLGFCADIVEDGVQALKALSEKRYGLLLTDCHMPEMDGFELSRQIRAKEAEGERFPIVAITASVMQQDVEACLAAGMDRCLAKPIEMPKLRSALRDYLPVDDEPATPISESAPPSAKPADALDLGPLRDMVGDDMETIGEILMDFDGSARSIIQEIRAAVDAESPAEVGAAAHKLKSSARSVGALPLGEICAELETAGKAGDYDAIRQLLPALEPAGEAVFAAIETVRETAAST